MDRSRSTFSPPGFTLLELVLCLMVITTFVAALGGVMISSHGAFVETMASSSVNETASRVVDRIVWELRFAPRESLDPPLPVNAPALTYSKVEGWRNGQPVLTAPRTISLVSGKVLVEGVAIAEGVKELTFTLSGTILTAAVGIEKTVSVGGMARRFSRRLEVQVPF